MAEVKKIATRDSYGNTLKELAAEGHDDLVVLDADLAAATKTGMFRKAHPDRHFDCGIAEGNMMGVAAGLATMGYVPFVSSFAMFAAGRAFEQIRNSIAYPRLNVKIGATHGGISVGEDGASHQCCEDFALMRSLPGMTVICPADDVEARAAVRAAYAMQGPVYLRFGRLAVPVFHDEATYHFELGKGEQITEGQRHCHHRHRSDGQRGPSGCRAAGRRGHPRPGHQHPHHQASGRGDRPQGRQGVRQGHHRRGAQRHRRSGRGRLRRSEREAAHPCPPRGRAGQVRLLRPRMGPAQAVRSGCSDHLQDRSRDAGLIQKVNTNKSRSAYADRLFACNYRKNS